MYTLASVGHPLPLQFLLSLLPNGLFAHVTGREEGIWGREQANGGDQGWGEGSGHSRILCAGAGQGN